MRFDDGYLSVVVAQLLQDFDRMFTKFSVLDDSLTMQLALGGQGIALGVMDFLALEFAAGQLVPLFEPMPSARQLVGVTISPHIRSGRMTFLCLNFDLG